MNFETLIPAKPLLTVQETALCLGVRASTLAKWRCQSTYPSLSFCKVGSRCMYPRDAVINFIKENTK